MHLDGVLSSGGKHAAELTLGNASLGAVEGSRVGVAVGTQEELSSGKGQTALSSFWVQKTPKNEYTACPANRGIQ